MSRSPWKCSRARLVSGPSDRAGGHKRVPDGTAFALAEAVQRRVPVPLLQNASGCSPAAFLPGKIPLVLLLYCWAVWSALTF